MADNLIIVNPQNLEKLKKSITKQGKEKLHILADFDRTLTQAFVDGEKVPSLISVLRSSGKYLGEDYAASAQALYERYHPIETDPNLSIKEKKKAMAEWWRNHFKLLIKSGLNQEHLKEVADSPKIKFREGASEFFDLLRQNNIPLIIMSSSGLGGDVIAMVLEKKGKLYPNIQIVSNTFVWNEKGNAVRVKEPIIHTFNKDETILKNLDFYPAIKERKNVLLLGDSLGDVGMIEGFDYEYLIKVGFLNSEIEENLESYKEAYDILILNDSSMRYINQLLKEIT